MGRWHRREESEGREHDEAAATLLRIVMWGVGKGEKEARRFPLGSEEWRRWGRSESLKDEDGEAEGEGWDMGKERRGWERKRGRAKETIE